MAKRKDPLLDARLVEYVERQHQYLLGCSVAEYCDLIGDTTVVSTLYRGRHPAVKYLRQKSLSKYRCIEWGFNFPEWWAVWQHSGKWTKRGTRRNQYVMGRYGDVGPYSPGNVYICLSGKNCRDGHEIRRAALLAIRGSIAA